MDAPQRTRQINRDRSRTDVQGSRGAKQVVIPMSYEEYQQCWRDAGRTRELVDRTLAEHPELFPPAMRAGYALHGFGRASQKLAGIRLRKVRLPDGSAFHLRPSFVMPYMSGRADELEYPLLLTTFGIPCWVLTLGFGHSDMFWQRQLERFGRNSLVGTTVRDPARLPEHLAADEHHVDWAGQKGYVATVAAEGCLLGLALTKAADEEHLAAAYGVFAAEARDVKPDYAPQTVNTDGWAATQNAFVRLFPSICVILCFLHGFLKIRDRCRKEHDLHRRVWEIYRAATAVDFRQRMTSFCDWWQQQTWTARVREVLAKLAARVEDYAVAYEHPSCLRTSNAVDRPMNRLYRLVYAGRGLHGHQVRSERRLRGWALLLNFRPYAHRSGQERQHQSPAHRLNGKRYHPSWLQNLLVSASLNGYHQPTPAIR
jgi:hypothetical protein